MKNKYLKKVLITCGISVLAGVLVFGVNAAFGAPSHNPPGDTVGPTFSGLTVTGDAEVRGNLVDSVDGEVNIDDDFQVTGDILANYIEATSIDIDSLHVSSGGSGLDISGVIKNSLSNNGGNVYIDDGLRVTGDADIQGDMSSSIGELSVVDDFGVHGQIYGYGNLEVEDPSVFWSDLTVKGNVSVQGDFSSSVGSLDVYDDFGVHGELYVYENLQVEDPSIFFSNLDVQGKLTANEIGTYKQKISGKYYISAGSTKILSSPSCGVGGQIISCNAVGYYYSSGWYVDNYSFVINKLNTDFSTNTCQVAATNGSTSYKYLQAIAICFYPNE